MNTRLTRPYFEFLAGAFILLTTITSRGLAPPLISVNSDEYPAWRDSINMKVITNSYTSLVDFYILLEKPKKPNVSWNLNLDVRQGTNTILRSALSCDILEPSISAGLSEPRLANKTVQRFQFSLDRSLINSSVIVFDEIEKNDKAPLPTYSIISPRIVQVSDMCSPPAQKLSSPTPAGNEKK